MEEAAVQVPLNPCTFFFYWQSAKIRQKSVASPSPALSPSFESFIKFDNENVNSVAAAFPTNKSTQKKPSQTDDLVS